MSTSVNIARILNKLANMAGFHLLRINYNLPIPEKKDIKYAADSQLIGVDINDYEAGSFLEKVILKYKKEFELFPAEKKSEETGYFILNKSFMAIDGNAYYSIIREHKPRRIIEIGSGYSTLLAIEAIKKNLSETGRDTEIISIEPYPPKFLKNVNNIRLIEKPVQEIDINLFESLEDNDILFVDSSHALKSGGDVQYEYCEIFPRLKPGVFVHIHDISLPKPYPRVYYENMIYWNEQYLLQAFLAFNSKFQVIWPGNYMMCKYPEKMKEKFYPEWDLMKKQFPDSEPSSFWIKSL